MCAVAPSWLWIEWYQVCPQPYRPFQCVKIAIEAYTRQLYSSQHLALSKRNIPYVWVNFVPTEPISGLLTLNDLTTTTIQYSQGPRDSRDSRDSWTDHHKAATLFISHVVVCKDIHTSCHHNTVGESLRMMSDWCNHYVRLLFCRGGIVSQDHFRSRDVAWSVAAARGMAGSTGGWMIHLNHFSRSVRMIRCQLCYCFKTQTDDDRHCRCLGWRMMDATKSWRHANHISISHPKQLIRTSSNFSSALLFYRSRARCEKKPHDLAVDKSNQSVESMSKAKMAVCQSLSSIKRQLKSLSLKICPLTIFMLVLDHE